MPRLPEETLAALLEGRAPRPDPTDWEGAFHAFVEAAVAEVHSGDVWYFIIRRFRDEYPDEEFRKVLREKLKR